MKRKIKIIFFITLYIFPAKVLAQYPIAEHGDSNSSAFSAAYDMLKGVAMWILGGIGFAAIFSLIFALILYLISGGDEDRIETSAKHFKTALVEIFIIILGLAVYHFAALYIDQQLFL